MTCIRFALLGSGFIGQVHAASLARHERTVLSMVADADPERAKALASRYGARAVTVAEAINSDAIDAVLIASSTPSHAALLEAAARWAVEPGAKVAVKIWAVEVLKQQPGTLVDVTRIGAFGYCFGGSTVLELVRAGDALSGVVSLHGGLATDLPAAGPVSQYREIREAPVSATST